MSEKRGPIVTIVGAGLAGCEAAYQLATRGVHVRLIEQKPTHRTPAQSMDGFAELVCSNSLRGSALTNAVGLMKEELRRVGSLVMACAEETKVPAGGALAVDREMFSKRVTQEIGRLPLIEVCNEVVEKIPDASPSRPVVLATGPLTGDALASELARVIGQDHLAYYDAIAPIVTYESLDLDRVFRQSRWGRSESSDGPRDAEALGDEAYLNCPMTEDEYIAFVQALLAAEKVPPRAFEKANYFEGCLPIEVMAERGVQTLSFGPMKPIGLTDPRTGRRPYAVVQLRQEDEAATAYNLVGFQTRMTHPSQARVFRMIPGLEHAEFQRFGSVHRNTFVDAPRVLDASLSLKSMPNVYLAGQITGVEGYVESAACGFLCALTLAQTLAGGEPVPPPATTTLGAILTHLGRGEGRFQPSNVTFAWLPPHPNRKLRKRDRYQALAERALSDLGEWCATMGIGPRSHISDT